MAILELSGSAASTSATTGAKSALIMTLGVGAAASVSVTTGDLSLISGTLITQVGLQADVSSETARVTQSGLQAEAEASVKSRVTQAGLQAEAMAVVPARVTQAMLQVDGGVSGQGARVTQAALQADVTYRRPETNAGLEFYVVDRFGTPLAYLDRAYDKAYLAQLNDVGSGSFRIHANDPKAGDENLEIGNEVLVRYRNVDIGLWIQENKSEELVSEGEEHDRVIAVSGRGIMATLEKGIVYPANLADPATVERVFTGETKAAIFLTLYNEFLNRGGGDLDVDFTATHDSDLIPWTDLNNLSYKAGQKLLDVAKQLTALGGDMTVTPDRVLHYRLAEGVDRSATVHFRHGQNILACTRSVSATDQGNVVLAEGQGIIAETTDGANIALYGRKEIHLPVQNTDDAGVVATASNVLIAQNATPNDAITLTVTEREFRPFIDYGLGDYVHVSIPGEIDGTYRVLSIALTESGEGEVIVNLGLNSLALELLVKMHKALAATRAAPSVGGAVARNLAAADPRSNADDHAHSIPRQALFTVEGSLVVGSNPLRIYNTLGVTLTITKILLSAATAPAGQAIIVDVNKNGTTIFTNQAHRPQIAAGANTGNTTLIDDATWLDGDYLTMDVDQVGNTSPGADLTVHVLAVE